MHVACGAGADMIQTIKTFAQTTNKPNVNVLAQIPSARSEARRLRRARRVDFTMNLLQDGSLRLRWKCSNPSGTVGTSFEVKRQQGGAEPFEFVGTTGVKSFTDDTLTGGSGLHR